MMRQHGRQEWRPWLRWLKQVLRLLNTSSSQSNDKKRTKLLRVTLAIGWLWSGKILCLQIFLDKDATSSKIVKSQITVSTIIEHFCNGFQILFNEKKKIAFGWTTETKLEKGRILFQNNFHNKQSINNIESISSVPFLVCTTVNKLFCPLYLDI
jgi:hypothetical protein